MEKVSVIIPVYNAAAYVEQAVRSALIQPQVREVLLIEDASPDGALIICKELVERDKRVRLLRHPNGENRGPGASRNLGIEHAREKMIAFLDADDFMLPDRFAATEKELAEHPDADGVYEAVGYHFQTEALKQRYLKRDGHLLTTVKYPIAPERLFREQAPVGRAGYANTNGWTVKRSVFERCGLFNESLPLHQDTDLFMRFAIAGRMYPGEIKRAVAMRRVHAENRITKPRPAAERFYHRIRMWCSTWSWAVDNGYRPEAKVVLRRIARQCRGAEFEEVADLGAVRVRADHFMRALSLCPRLRRTPRFYLLFLWELPVGWSRQLWTRLAIQNG